GRNAEVSSKLTMIRRPGSSVYNSNTYPSINRFFEYRLFNSNSEIIRVLADTANAIYDVTGPGSNNPTPTPLFVKSAGAGSTFFENVGNNIFFSDGVESRKRVGSLLSWLPSSSSFEAGNFIIGPNGNIEEFIGAQTATIIGIEVETVVRPGHPSTAKITLFFSPSTPLNVPLLTNITLSGLTTYSSLNGQTFVVQGSSNNYQAVIYQLFPPLATTSFTAETGSVTTGTGS